MQIQWYHIYRPEVFYPVVLTQYASNVSDFNYIELIDCETSEDLKKIKKTYAIGQTQQVAIKFQTRLADLIWEAKLRGFQLQLPTINSEGNSFAIDKVDKKKILLPLTTLSGVAEKSGIRISDSVSNKPIESYEDLITRKEDGKTVFNKKALEGLGLYELNEQEIELFNSNL